jgi:hypothetical protein
MAFQGARYLTGGARTSVRTPRWRKAVQASFAATLAILFLLTGLSSAFLSAGVSPLVAATSGSSAEDTLNKAAQEAGAEGTPEGFDAIMAELQGNPTTTDRDSFAHLLRRVLFIDYINYTPDASSINGKTPPSGGLNCNTNAPGAGTLVYHNCDVPNITTEFMQDLVAMATGGQGAKGATVSRATVDVPIFGGSVNIPGGSVPVDPAARSVKYTGLELFGYNLKLTRYSGEWDHIKVMTSARALSNFGFMDGVRLSVKATIDGIAAGLNVSISNASGKLASGDIFGAIGAAFSGFLEGAASGAVNTILDTSDFNVFTSVAWYRTGIGSTLYGARELSQVELAALAKGQYLNLITQSAPADARVPADLQSIAGGPPPPKEAISKCEYINASSQRVAFGNTSAPPGPTEAQCQQVAQTAYDLRVSSGVIVEGDTVQYFWTVDGTQKQESLSEWRAAQSKYFDTAKRYGMNCDVDVFAARAAAVAAVQACWGPEHAAAVDRELKRIQQVNNDAWVDDLTKPENINEWLSGDPARNFNAPWNRFICVDANGNDIMNGSAPRTVYDQNGNLNSGCSPVRPPVQNGFFGNGYIGSQPAVDTRNAAVDTSIFGTILDIPGQMTRVADMGLTVSIFATRLTNSVIALTFSPILETLGLDELIVKAVEALRDSLFFPLAALMIGLSAMAILFRTIKERNYSQQFVSVLLICLTFLTGVFLLYRPAAVVKAVDEVPSRIEMAIVGSIFNVGDVTQDNICSASSSATSTPPGEDLRGNVLPYSPADGTRSLMCEAWRVFAFTPWAYAQWGTSVDKLSDDEFTNTNSALVGTAAVNMGGGAIVNNWGLYQLDVTSSGTSTTENPREKTGATSRDFYRIVDAQAGPNNGAGTDGSRFAAWTGQDAAGRGVVGLFSPVVAAVGAFTVISYSLTKILLSFVVTVMILFLPFMFLIGLFPTLGRMRLKAYIGTIVGLILQRIVLVVLLALFFRVLIGVASAANGYLLSAFFSLVICGVFLHYKKDIMGMITRTTGNTFGQTMGSDLTQQGNFRKLVPGTVQNYADMAGAATIGAVGGAFGSFISGGNMLKGAREAADYRTGQLQNKQRRIGFGFLQGAVNAGGAAAAQTRSDLDKDPGVRSVREDLRSKTLLSKDLTQEEKVAQETSKATGEKIDLTHPDTAYSKGEQTHKANLDSASARRMLTKLAPKKAKIQKLKGQKEEMEHNAPITAQIAESVQRRDGNSQRLLTAKNSGEFGFSPDEQARYNRLKADIIREEAEYDQQADALVSRTDAAYDHSRTRRRMFEEMEAMKMLAEEAARRAEANTEEKAEDG